jgi:hypothetical protein
MSRRLGIILYFSILLHWCTFYSLFLFLSIMQQINNINSHLIHTMIVRCIKCY